MVRLYGDFGYTYRVPTFTEMFYIGPTTIGNPDLEPESALSEEIGIKYLTEEDLDHLIRSLKKYYDVAIDLDGKEFVKTANNLE